MTINKNLAPGILFLHPLLLLLGVLNVACAGEGQLWGMDVGEFTGKLSDHEFLTNLSPDRQEISAVIQHIPGAGWYLGQILSEGRPDLAIIFFETQYNFNDSVYSRLSLEALLRLRSTLNQHREIVNLTGRLLSASEPDPVNESWFYTHRLESLIQLGESDRAFRELTRLINENPELFTSPALPHGLLYYRALTASLAAEPADLDRHILPYAIVSNARFGHREVHNALVERFGDEVRQLKVYPWLETKVLLMDGEYHPSLDIALELLAEPEESFFMLMGHRPEEGLALDLFRSIMASGRIEEGLSLFSQLIAGISPGTRNGQVSEARFLEYSGQFLAEGRRYTEAAASFEKAFLILQDLWERNSEADSIGQEMLAALSRRREQLLWRWVSALMDDPSLSSVSDMYRSLSLVRNPDYFHDISDEYISRLLRSRDWSTLNSFIRTAGVKLSPQLAISTLSILKTLAEKNVHRLSSRNIDRELSRYQLPGSLLNQALLLSEPGVNANTLDELFLQGRFISYSISGLEAPPPAQDETLKFTQVLQGFGLFGLYRSAAEYLGGLAPGYVADPAILLEMVNEAYNAEDWYGALSILETAISRSYRYREGPGELIAAAGGLEELLRLLYPRAWLRQAENFALEYDINPYFFISLMREESRFNPRAGSSAGALGLGQIIPQTAEDIARRMRLDNYDLFDPEDNMKMSLNYLSYLSSRFSTIWEILAAYNAGQGRVDRWNRELPSAQLPGFVFLSHVPFAETRLYMRRVINSFMIYDYLYSPGEQQPGNDSSIRSIIHEPIIPRQRTGG